MSTLKSLLKDAHEGRFATRHSVDLLLDAAVAADYQRAENAVALAKKELAEAQAKEPNSLSGRLTTAARERLEEAEARRQESERRATEHLVTFTFKSIGEAWHELRSEHPPTAEQLADPNLRGKDDASPEWNVDTFPLAAVHACLVEIQKGDAAPDAGPFDLEDVRGLKKELSSGSWNMLFSGAVVVNQGVSRVPLSLTASERKRASAGRSKQQ